jgi:simple sugar transport system permease protein
VSRHAERCGAIREEAKMSSKAVLADPQAIREAARSKEVPFWRRFLLRPEVGAVFGAIIIWIVFAILAWDRGFVSARGTATYLEVAAQLGILAVAVALLMIAGEFDLSVGSMIGASSVIAALIPIQLGMNFWWGIISSLVFVLLIGFVNGVVVVRTQLPSFIVTLASLFIIRGVTIGITRLVTGRTQVGGLQNVPGFDSAATIFGADIPLFGAAFPVSIVWWMLVASISTWVLLRTQFGNWIFAVGGNAVAARMVGVPVNRVKILLFMFTGFAAWLVAMIEVTSARSADVLRGEQREFYAIIAAVIGGVLLTGGYGTVIGAVLGALIYGMVRQGVVFAGIDADWVQAVLGAMLLAAVLVNRYVRRRAMGARG